jgi:tetratricopeptide (TPR) repeat protein
MRAVTIALLVASLARAEEPSPSPSPGPVEVKAAREYYDLGADAYEKGDYAAALRAFEAAWAETPHAELQFNIARCHERLGQWEEAAQAYELYLRTKKEPPDVLEMRARIAELRLRAHEAAHPAVADEHPRPHGHGLRAAAGVTLGAALILAGGGTGAYLSAWHEYGPVRDACQSRCSPQAIDGLRSRVETAQVGGAVLWTLAGVALVADVALWALDARARRR